jgi:hypothetical protein
MMTEELREETVAIRGFIDTLRECLGYDPLYTKDLPELLETFSVPELECTSEGDDLLPLQARYGWFESQWDRKRKSQVR